MTDQIKNQISAFVDDELPGAEAELLVRRLCADKDLRRQAARYGLIGGALRGSNLEIQMSLSQAVQNAVEAATAEDGGEAVAASPATALQRRDWKRPVAGAAIAASVAVAALVGLRLQAPADLTGEEVVAGAQTTQVAADLVAANPVPPTYVVPETAPPSQASRAKLQLYMVSHSQYGAQVGRQGVMVYRTVGFPEAPGVGQTLAPTAGQPLPERKDAPGQ